MMMLSVSVLVLPCCLVSDLSTMYLSISLKKAPVLNFEIDCHMYLHVVSIESCGIYKFKIRNRFSYNLLKNYYLSAVSLNELA